jgi:hypothetical protein
MWSIFHVILLNNFLTHVMALKKNIIVDTDLFSDVEYALRHATRVAP